MEDFDFHFFPLFWVKNDIKIWTVATGWLCQLATHSSALQCALFQDLKISYCVNEATKKFKEPRPSCPAESKDEEGCAVRVSYV